MIGQSDPQRTLFYQLSLETFVPAEHPLRAVRPLIEDQAIRRACQNLYAPIGRPSIPPEQLFLALVGGYLLGITSERKLVMELQCNMALRWFVGLNLDQDAWDASTFCQNRRRRFDESGLLEQVFDDTIKRAMAAGLVSRHISADGTLVRANASFKSFVPIEVALDPAEYKRRLRAQDKAAEAAGRGQSAGGLPRREAWQCDPSVAHRPGLPVRLEGDVGDRRLPRLHRQCGDGEPPPVVARPRGGDLPEQHGGEGGMSDLAGPGETPAALYPHHARCRQGVLPRGLPRGVVRAGHRATYRDGGPGQR